MGGAYFTAGATTLRAVRPRRRAVQQPARARGRFTGLDLSKQQRRGHLVSGARGQDIDHRRRFRLGDTGRGAGGHAGLGALLSRDGGATWSAVRGLEGRTVRAFAFALTLVVAGTDRGIYTSSDGLTWTQSGLANRNINTVAVQAIHAPVRLVAGGDGPASGGGLPLFESLDGGATWKQSNPAISGTITVKLTAGPLPPTGNVRPLLLGTNTGLFASKDNGATFTPLSGGGLLPTTDYTQAAFITEHFDRFYVASDGGGSGSGGLWRTNSSGQAFTSLRPPDPSITALAVSSDDKPLLYVAAFRPSSHAVSLWVYHDTGGTPQGPPVTPTPWSAAPAPRRPATSPCWRGCWRPRRPPTWASALAPSRSSSPRSSPTSAAATGRRLDSGSFDESA